MTRSLPPYAIGFLFCFFLSCRGNSQLIAVEGHFDRLERLTEDTLQTIGFIQEEMNLVADYSRLSQIILLRHGEPALDKKGWRNRKEAIQFVKDYDSVGIYTPAFIPVNLQLGELEVIHTSSIPRSIATAKAVFDHEEIQQPDSLFREFERKIFSFPNVRLPLSWWLNTSRVLWPLNSKNCPWNWAEKTRTSFSQTAITKRCWRRRSNPRLPIRDKSVCAARGF